MSCVSRHPAAHWENFPLFGEWLSHDFFQSLIPFVLNHQLLIARIFMFVAYAQLKGNGLSQKALVAHCTDYKGIVGVH